MTTERLYYDNAYLTEFDARVAACREGGWIALDRSAFYPTSGGQPFDTGVLTTREGQYPVVDVQVENGVVWHQAGAALPVGAPVQGKVDWARRWDHMQQHAGDHMLAGVIWEKHRGVTLGLHIGEENSSIDVRFPDGRTHLTEEETAAIEDVVNRRAQRDDPILCWFPEPEELSVLPLRKQPTVDRHVRVVAIGDWEMVPCGGTHPRTAGQVGPVKILSAAPSRGNLRLTFVAGMRAIGYFQKAARSARETAALLNAGLPEAPAALIRERESAAAARRDVEKRLLAAALEAIRREGKSGLYASHVTFADPDTLSRAAAELIREGGTALLSCPRGQGRHLVFATGGDADMAALMRRSGARGGGKPEFAQGSAPDGEALLRARAEMEERRREETAAAREGEG